MQDSITADRLTNICASGASYAATGPDILDPTPPYKTSCNGPNYIDFLSNGFNQSVIKTKNYAVPGSSVSSDFANQIDGYMKNFTVGLFPGLSARNSLYHAEFGINDITSEGSHYATLEPAIFVKYTNLLETVRCLTGEIRRAEDFANYSSSCIKAVRGTISSLTSRPSTEAPTNYPKTVLQAGTPRLPPCSRI